MPSLTLLLLPLSLLALYHSTTSTHARQVPAAGASSFDQEAETRNARNKATQTGSSSGIRKRSADPLSGLLARRLSDLMARRRSLENALRGPPKVAEFQDDDMTMPRFAKREDEWIWMPAHGYIPMPRDESQEQGRDQDNGIGNLLRYG